MIATNDLIYLVTNVFYAYILCKFMRAFFGQKGRNQKAEILSFAAYYCVNSVIYLSFHETEITVCSNLLLYFLLSFNYNAKVKSRITSVFFIYAILFSAETIVLLLLRLLGMRHFSEFNELEYLIAQIVINLTIYMIVLIFSNFKLKKENYPIPILRWIAIIAIPAGTVLPTFFITETITGGQVSIMVISEVIILLVDFFVFYLYEYIVELYTELMEKRLSEQQTMAYAKELEIIAHSQQKFKIFRHDMRHHLSILAELIKREEYTEALNYLDDVGDYLSTHQEKISTGNTAVDSIVNYMAGVAEQAGISLKCDIKIPEKLQIAAFDLNGIISNLLDNAIKVVQLLPIEYGATIQMTMQYTRGLLFLTVENPYTAAAQQAAKAQGHGLGLKSVQMAVEKYDGILKCSDYQNLFRVEVILYEKQM